MNIPKAKKVLTDNLTYSRRQKNLDLFYATKLAIEALGRLEVLRDHPLVSPCGPLPGEIEE